MHRDLKKTRGRSACSTLKAEVNTDVGCSPYLQGGWRHRRGSSRLLQPRPSLTSDLSSIADSAHTVEVEEVSHMGRPTENRAALTGGDPLLSRTLVRCDIDPGRKLGCSGVVGFHAAPAPETRCPLLSERIPVSPIGTCLYLSPYSDSSLLNIHCNC